MLKDVADRRGSEGRCLHVGPCHQDHVRENGIRIPGYQDIRLMTLYLDFLVP
jgi:hypothetical protein